jgi:hypothetical protein
MFFVGRTAASVYGKVGADEHEKWHNVPLMSIDSIEPLDLGPKNDCITD